MGRGGVVSLRLINPAGMGQGDQTLERQFLLGWTGASFRPAGGW